MAAETLYTAIYEYLERQRKSALAEVEFARAAIRLEYSTWTDARLVASEARLACVKMMQHNLLEAFDNVPIPPDWRTLVDKDKRDRRKKIGRKSLIKGILKRTRGES